ncbi:zinc-binding alcohol dehydrogenase family protein [Desulfovibrio sp. TomC]|uniref:zinc-binding alcohol dehydrogenase family protein n=1 Tax=Desulfovibrio sp. TomC TaxID=1562888 RepID=UPI0005755EA9|nr:zinc-binding alcohol dehydrogenase family protein [Desulfovibrio sp. TomC]KHK02676.1 NADPH:quinone reductase [Desulfovibrio sp. TomC]
MKAILAVGGHDPAAEKAFIEAERPQPTPGPHDVLVRVAAAGVNPVDTKIFARLTPGEERILGYDACGTVAGLGDQVRRFDLGQTVYCAGTLTGPGSNAEYLLVDERRAALAPATLEPVQAAALPLTALTAWEGLFDRLGFTPAPGANTGKRLLVIGGAGGVGSMVIQLGVWAGLTVAATAGRPESAAWCRTLGASVVIGRGDVAEELAQAGMTAVEAVYCTTHMEEHWTAMARVLAPQGAICLIDDPAGPLDLTIFKQKSARICWEFMFTRSLFGTEDLDRQGFILDRVARLVEAGTLRTTVSEVLTGLSAENVRAAHLRQKSGTMVGKQVIAV